MNGLRKILIVVCAISIACANVEATSKNIGNEKLKKHENLMNSLIGKDKAIQENAKKELIVLGEKAIPILKEGLNNKDWYKRFQVIDVLRKIEGAESTNLLLNVALKDEDEGVRLLALRGLVERKVEVKPKVLINWLNDENRHIRYWSLDMIKENTTDVGVVNCLREGLLAEKEWDIKCKIARTLGKLQKVGVELKAEPIMRMLKEECRTSTSLEFDEGSYAPITEIIKRQYAFALIDIGTSAIPFLRKSERGEKEGEFVQRITIILGKLQQKEVFSTLCDIALNANDGWIRSLAVSVLGDFKEKEAIPILEKALQDKFWVKPTKLDVVIPGHEYMNIRYPVRSEAFSALIKLGVKVKQKGTGPNKYHEYEIIEE